jgi:hypothetical protein
MDIKYQLQLDEETQLEKLCNRLRKKQNRNHIVEDLIEVRKAKKQALAERKKYYVYQKVPANVRICQDGMNKARSGIPSTMRFYKIKKKIIFI